MKREYICPFCFNRHKMHEVVFACKNENCQEEDHVYANFWGEQKRHFPTVTAGPVAGTFAFIKPKMPREVECKSCNTKTNVRLCQTCHSVLPRSISDYDDYIIAVIGAKQSGKSHYIGVLINEITQSVSTAYQATIAAENETTLKRYKNKFRDPLYKQRRVLDVTQSAQTDKSVKQPLLYTMKFSQGSKIKVVTLSLFDSAGEDLKSQDEMEKHTKYISNASGIICLLDPLQIPSVREEIKRLAPHTPLPQEDMNTEAHDILTRTTNLIRNELNIKDAHKIQIPMAVSFSKTDAISMLLDPTSRLLQPGRHTEKGMFDVNDFESVSDEMHALVNDWTYGNIPNQLELNYKDYAFFGVSALGHAPNHTMTVNKIEPYRVVDPFLWILWKNNVIKGRKENL